MFVFHYASTTNPFLLEIILDSMRWIMSDSWILELVAEVEVRGDWVTLV